MKRIYMKHFVALVFATLVMILSIQAQDVQQDSAALAAADTSHFSVNHNNGWHLFNSYVAAYQSDSVQLELIIMHANTIPWDQEQYIGKIRVQNLIPSATRNVSFSLITVQFAMRIDSTGRCYLKKTSGNLPEEENIAIPLKIYYRK